MPLSEARLIEPIIKDLGEGMMIRRYLPQIEPQGIGPYIFFDYVPGNHFEAGHGVDVRPHPHIGLSTLSYFFEGRMQHRDSLGYNEILEPGDVLLMTSGKGIVHSERSPQADRRQARNLHMVQFWLALPEEHEEDEPSVSLARAAELPRFEIQPGLQAQLAIGSWQNQHSPVQSHLAPLLIDLQAHSAGNWQLDSSQADLGLFVIRGELKLGEQSYGPGQLVALPRQQQEVAYSSDCHFLVFGGQALDGHRIIWWNLVASRQELLEAAKTRWQNHGFPVVPGDEQEFIPLPNQ